MDARREAFAVAAIFSGGPSTAYALATGGDPLEATRAAGAILVSLDAPWPLLYGAAAAVHLCVSALWTLVLARFLPAQRTYLAAALAAVGIAVLDLGILGRAFASVRPLAFGPQLGDHLAFCLLVAFVLKQRNALVPRAVTPPSASS